MDSITFFEQNQFLSAIVLLLIGAAISLIFSKMSSKTGIFRYFVVHNKLGTSANDEIFGAVRLTWQGQDVRNLYLSTIEVENSTSCDYENIHLKVFTNRETVLLNQRTEIVDTPYIVPWDPDYEKQINVPSGEQASPEQLEVYSHNREYRLPVLNRGQKIRLSYLSSNPNDDNFPVVCISTLSKGVKLKEQMQPHLVLSPIFGVPIPIALTRALLLAVLVVLVCGLWLENVWLVALICMLFGLTGQIFGALAYKIERFFVGIITG
ncbi:hypothetical protein OMA37_003945 [Vibrio fluvialis]|uniref:hypothetical protein n=1 Tax=Vibrio fluvialis TaxID=676 RepID=UPI001BAFE901|nr:hypothetical protein [Vibrio fluvialis]EKO3383870.1 hypothetical protein [Vibrio fluvialis]EKO3392127.1 hypothetical protein [Vibrio fluvialis]EKO3970192.1 hypothetical protein [Vibrio fluvialis]ELI1831725.1 hypothetical protein [Vibrio fluvialis]ELL0571590.1 hypothetical protein [Vibrio fluvialis]